MRRVIFDSDLEAMKPEQRSAALDDLVRCARGRANGSLDALRGEISAFEARFGIDSATMLREVESGARRETLEISDWLIATRRRDHIEQARSTRAD